MIPRSRYPIRVPCTHTHPMAYARRPFLSNALTCYWFIANQNRLTTQASMREYRLPQPLRCAPFLQRSQAALNSQIRNASSFSRPIDTSWYIRPVPLLYPSTSRTWSSASPSRCNAQRESAHVRARERERESEGERGGGGGEGGGGRERLQHTRFDALQPR
jgi:hypothetical protein